MADLVLTGFNNRHQDTKMHTCDETSFNRCQNAFFSYKYMQQIFRIKKLCTSKSTEYMLLSQT